MREAPNRYQDDGWAEFAPDPEIAAWARACAPVADALLDDPGEAQWYRCAGTWFAGVNSLPNDAHGGVAASGVPPLSGAPVAFARDALGHRDVMWDRAQISVTFPGYPAHGSEDTEASYRFRLNRFAAHVDGLERFADRRRKLNETHSFLLGIPLGTPPPGASPFVIWRGSHHIMREAFERAFAGHPPETWFDIDITDAYTAARKACFETCEVVEVAPPPGGSYVMHPLALHGVAPWSAPDDAPPRAVAYFRPDAFARDAARWLSA